MDELLGLVAYLKGEPGLARLLEKLIERYRTLGRIGGSVKLVNLTVAEREALSQFFRKDYSRNASATVSFASFEKALAKSRFSGLAMEDILEAYEGKRLVTRSEKMQQHAERKEQFFRQLEMEHPHAADWIYYIREKGRGTRMFHSLYDVDADRLRAVIASVCVALGSLPGRQKYERLPFFSQRLERDPHAFDLDTDRGRAFLHALQFLLLQRGELSFIKGKLNSEEANDLLQSFRLLRDDLLNFVTCAGLAGHTEKGIHPLWAAAIETKAVMNVPLREVAQLAKCRPHSGKAVFVVENSGVCSAILDQWPFPFPPPLISTNGQFKLAALLLIDLLAKEDVTIYYSGDFDPEGLQMAQRLQKRAPDHIRLWRYTLGDYEKCRSEKEIPMERLASLNTIDLEELKEVKASILAHGMAGYQEELILDLVGDMERVFLV